MAGEDLGILGRFLDHNRACVALIRNSRRYKWVFAFRPDLRRLYAECQNTNTPDSENAALAAVMNAFEEGLFWKTLKWGFCAGEDISLFCRQFGRRKTVDRSDKRKKDYYSVAVIVKNEARYMKEFILFYMATGADRIYLYDNDSTDNLLEVLAPFVESGFVIYRKWPGHTVQTGAYRDAVRRTRRRTKWLALIDADEFLFSPKGKMPEQLKAFEQYPGLGVNWVMFGPNGHEKRPEGLVMDAYTAAFAETDAGINCHIKTVVQPKEVFCIYHVHYAVYKRNGYAIGEDGVPLDNRSNRAFSLKHHRELFRINHYCTRSLEDLREKCRKGRADGSPDADYDNLLRQFDYPMIQDYAVKPYADIVRSRYGEYGTVCRTKAGL